MGSRGIRPLRVGSPGLRSTAFAKKKVSILGRQLAETAVARFNTPLKMKIIMKTQLMTQNFEAENHDTDKATEGLDYALEEVENAVAMEKWVEEYCHAHKNVRASVRKRVCK